jgi:hypothetical protein
MLLSFVMDVIWRFIRVGLCYLEDNGLEAKDVRLLWSALYPRGSMAMSEMHRLARKSRREWIDSINLA